MSWLQYYSVCNSRLEGSLPQSAVTKGSHKRQSDGGARDCGQISAAKTTTSSVIECSECVYEIVLEDGIQIFMGVADRHIRNNLPKGRPIDNTVNVC